MDRTSQAERPADRPAGFQRWRHLLFLHWELPVDAIAALIPKELTVDTFEGKAFIGLVAFTMLDVAPRWAPSVPGTSNFHELNVRTYVHRDGKDPAVWFFSLDAASSIAVLAARAGWHLPYHRASMELDVQDRDVSYTSDRSWPGPKPAHLAAKYRIGEPLGNAVPGTFEHFLVERYLLFADTGNGLQIGQVHHKPYPIHTVEMLSWEESMVRVLGLPDPVGEPHALYSPGVDVDVYDLRDPV